MTTRANRWRPSACRAAVAAAFGEAAADEILEAAGVAGLPEQLPAGPRDLAALAAELEPFVLLYRELLRRAPREGALAVMRRAIVDSGAASHGESQAGQAAALAPGEPLVLTSPPPPGFSAPPERLRAAFDLSMQFFSCEGELLSYTPELVRFTITSCNWCRALDGAGAPELVPLFCETDERFMDGHPTHRLRRPEAIGLGHARCDFQFIPIAEGSAQDG